MLHRISSVWFWFGSDRPGFCLGTSFLITLILLMYAVGVQASLSLGPGGDFPRVRGNLLYYIILTLPSLLVSVAFLLLVGPCQERRWGTVAFLALSILTMTILPLLYTLVLFVGGGEASRICGYSAIQLALFAAHCRQVAQRRLLRCLPVWFLPWLLLLMGLLLLPGTPALRSGSWTSFLIGCMFALQPGSDCPPTLPHRGVIHLIYIKSLTEYSHSPPACRFHHLNFIGCHRSRSLSQMMPGDQAAAPPMRDPSVLNPHPWVDPAPAWIMKEFAALSEAEGLEEQMLRAGILASLQDAPDNPDAKVEVPKSSVSSLRLQQLEKMGFPTEKAVLALAASKQLDGAISLLIDDGVGEQAVVVSKGKSPLLPEST
uniref:Peptidase S54 rhomboid domain-containing protein n=1 Tax=Sander lucioperca TaxID=283035 RepID=A0A8C9WXG5_SANLU